MTFTGIAVGPGRLAECDFLVDYRHEADALAALQAAIKRAMPIFDASDWIEPAIIAAKATTLDEALKALGFGVEHPYMYASFRFTSLPTGGDTGLEAFVLPVLAASGYLVSGLLILQVWPPYESPRTGLLEEDSSFVRYQIADGQVRRDVGRIRFEGVPIVVELP